jgi:hypothetical protein
LGGFHGWGEVLTSERFREKMQLKREKVIIRSEEPRSKRKCRGGMHEFIRAISLLVQLELTRRISMRAEVTTSLGPVLSTILLLWLMRGGVGGINAARLVGRTTILSFGCG